MKYYKKILPMMLILIIFLPSVQSSNIFQDIKSIDKGMKEANSKLLTMKDSLNDLADEINSTNGILEDVKKSASLLDEIRQDINDMSNKIQDASDKANEALDTVDKVDSYIEDFISILWIGIGIIALAFFVLIGIALAILRKK